MNRGTTMMSTAAAPESLSLLFASKETILH
jgi:hypothetical protein